MPRPRKDASHAEEAQAQAHEGEALPVAEEVMPADEAVAVEAVAVEAAPVEAVAAPSDHSGTVVFRATNHEPVAFGFAGFAPERELPTKRLIWRVPADEADLHERHFFVVTGRIARVVDAG